MARKRPFQKQMGTVTGGNSSFALVNDLYKSELKYFDDLTIYKQIIFGKIEVEFSLKIDRIKYFVTTIINCFRRDLISDTNISKMKGLFAISNSLNSLEAYNQIIEAVTGACLCMVTMVSRVPNVDLYLQQLGYSNIKVPLFLYEMMKIMRASMIAQKVPGIENSLLRFSASMKIIGKNVDLKKISSDEYVTESIFRLQAFCNYVLPSNQVMTIDQFHKEGRNSMTFMSCDILTDNGSHTFKIGNRTQTEGMVYAWLMHINYRLMKIEGYSEIFNTMDVTISEEQFKAAILKMNSKIYGINTMLTVVDKQANDKFTAVSVETAES